MRIILDLVSFSEDTLILSDAFLQLQKGISCARSDDTKSLKGAIIDWLKPQGEVLNPPLARNVKHDRGFNHEATGALLCPATLDWSDPECVLFYDMMSQSNIPE